MKILYSWLKELLPGLDLAPEELSKRLLLLGFEVENLESRGPAFTGVVVGAVVSAEKHPNADRLKLCKVTDGGAEYTVVCGAPNVAAGQRVAFARVGAALPGGLSIARAKIRGTESAGMICSASELGLENGKSPGIMVLDPAAPLGKDFAQHLGGPDAVLDVSVTPNRPDCLSHLGLARELAASLGLSVKTPSIPEPKTAAIPARPVAIQDGDCTRYLGRSFRGLRIGPSPAWLKGRLEALGLRSVNNAVDATNLVLLELGQPTHLFDADRLTGANVRIRPGRAGETFKALNDKTYELSPECLVVADGDKAAAIAGVMGGRDSEITEKTVNAFLEVAHFKPGRVRRSARKLGLSTDSSLRFSRGVDASGVEAAERRATALILQLCGGEAGPVKAEGEPPAPRPAIRVSSSDVCRILGARIDRDKVADCLKLLGDFDEAKSELRPPGWRRDLEGPEDAAEDVARHLGYDSVPYGEPAVRLPAPTPATEAAFSEHARDVLCAQGFLEAYNYDFVSEDELRRYFGASALPQGLLRLHNPLSVDWAYLRPTLMIGLLRSAALNFNRGAAGVRLFEVGKSYLGGPDGEASERLFVMGLLAGSWPSRPDWRQARRDSDLFDGKAAVEALCRPGECGFRAAADDADRFHPNAYLEALVSGAPIGHVGELHPALLARWQMERVKAVAFRIDLQKLGSPAPAPFKAFSSFPSVRRDLSIVVDAAARWEEARSAALEAGGSDLARLELVDVFTGAGVPAGKKSLTLRLTFSRMDRTLKDAEVSAAVESVLRRLGERLKAALRA